MILGIAGHMRSGKDTLAAYFVRAHGFARVGFADALKDEVLTRLPRTLAAIGELAYPELSTLAIGAYLLKTKPPVIRALLQEYGTQVRRADDPAYWLDRWEERRPVWGNVVAPDVRFTNEAEHVKAIGGMVVRVERPGHGGDGHESERLDFPWDHVFQNAGTIQDLERHATTWYAYVTGRDDR